MHVNKLICQRDPVKPSVNGNDLSEAASTGDCFKLRELLSTGYYDVNARNVVNGWTPLHWACKRDQIEATKMLLDYGADPLAVNARGDIPSSLTTHPLIRQLLGAQNDTVPIGAATSNPVHCRANTTVPSRPSRKRFNYNDIVNMPTTSLPTFEQEFILRVRLAKVSDPDFIEIVVPHRESLTYDKLLAICCEELDVAVHAVERLRKLPDTRLRNDGDVRRLRSMQRLEVVMKAATSAMTITTTTPTTHECANNNNNVGNGDIPILY